MKLLVLPTLLAASAGGNRVRITQKFLSGVAEFVKYWPGPVSVLIEPTTTPGSDLDQIDVDVTTLPFELQVAKYETRELAAHIDGAAIVLAGASYRQNEVSAWCNARGVPCVYVTENSLRTRNQIDRANTSHWLVRLRRAFWEWRQERHQAAAIASAQGVQCNGTPTYAAYRHLNADPLLFFDTRMSTSMLATAANLERRLSALSHGAPLRLLFSGRLVPIKGADHLIDIARALKQRGLPFELTICGDGALRRSMQERIEALDLGRDVRLAGLLNFERELVPFVKKEVDLFVCCHRQGDPSCTYLETMACGVPIVGYDNEALVGIVQTSGAGWISPMNRPEHIADLIVELSRDRAALAAASRTALAFASGHTLEVEFRRRAEHLHRIARAARSCPDDRGLHEPIAQPRSDVEHPTHTSAAEG